ncbi:MAG: hypothetical protein O7I42_19720 [Alphaproteobacteria bacterium]|nr:hypothetical protein [Alphaproteobacteria bacterium]
MAAILCVRLLPRNPYIPFHQTEPRSQITAAVKRLQAIKKAGLRPTLCFWLYRMTLNGGPMGFA